MKQEWIENVLAMAKEQGKILDMKKLLAEFSLVNHCDIRVGREILKAMEIMNQIKIEEGEIYVSGFK